MNENLKRFFYYWRLPILFFILFFALLWLSSSLEGDAAGIIGALWLFVDIPCLLFFTVRAIFLRIRSAITYRRTGIRDEEFVFPEVNFVRAIVDAVEDEIDSVSSLSFGMKTRCIIFRLLGVLLIAGGITGCFFFYDSTFLIVVFTLVIIGGATLWLVANPESYNSQVEGARMVSCPRDLTDELLFNSLRTIHTSLGAPRFAKVRSFKKPVMVYGSASDDYIYVVYRARLFQYYYVSTLSSVSLQENKSTADSGADEEGEKSREFAFYLDEICDAVEKAVASVCAD